MSNPSPTPTASTGVPLFLRKFFVDFVETAIGMVFALQIAFPHNVSELKQAIIIVGVALASALVSAIRRAAPSFLGWLNSKLGVSGT